MKSGKGRIRCIKRIKNPGPFDEHDKEHAFDCESVVHYYKGDNRANNEPTIYNCFASISRYTFEANCVDTIGEFCKPGDVVSIKWIGNNGNQYTRENQASSAVTLYADEVELIVKRTNKRGDCKRFAFNIDRSVCPDNSARMIRTGCNW